MHTHQPLRRSGMTMIEIMVSTAVLSLVLLTVALVTKTGNGVFRTTQARDALRQRTQTVLDRIADAVSTASKATFAAAPTAPFGSATLDFRTPTGIAGSVISWSTTNRIAYQATALHSGHEQEHESGHAQPLQNDGEIVLTRNVGAAGSVSTVLATHVADYLEGETANGKDDNGNGLIDERGLSFVLTGDQLTIRVTLADLDSDGRAVWVSSQTEVRLRN